MLMRRSEESEAIVRSTLARIFGKSVLPSIDYVLDSEYSMDTSTALANPVKFLEALDSIFGSEGAQIVENELVRSLKGKFKLPESLPSLVEVSKMLGKEGARSTTVKTEKRRGATRHSKLSDPFKRE